MGDRATWLALAERCEKATGPDREIDVLIAEMIGDVPIGYARHDAFTWTCRQQNRPPLSYTPACFTESIDAITVLIERGLPGHCLRFGRSGREAYVMIRINLAEWSNGKNEYGILALALCAAFCRAMAERGTT